jgi:hypothetical protein
MGGEQPALACLSIADFYFILVKQFRSKHGRDTSLDFLPDDR